MSCIIKIQREGLDEPMLVSRDGSSSVSSLKEFIHKFCYAKDFTLSKTLEKDGSMENMDMSLQDAEERKVHEKVHIIRNNEEYYDFKAIHDRLVIVLFTSISCQFCKKIQKELEVIAEKFPEVLILEVDIDDMETLPDRRDVEVIPTVKLFKNEELVDTFIGTKTETLHTKISNQIHA